MCKGRESQPLSHEELVSSLEAVRGAIQYSLLGSINRVLGAPEPARALPAYAEQLGLALRDVAQELADLCERCLRTPPSN